MSTSLLQPTYWFVYGLAWPDTGPDQREAAFAVAPATIPRERLSRDAADILRSSTPISARPAGGWCSSATSPTG